MSELDTTKVLTYKTAVTTSPRILDEVLPGLGTGKFGIIAGTGGVGKSFCGLQSGLAVAAGRDIHSLYSNANIKEGKVAYISVEDTLDDMHRRLVSMHKQIKFKNDADEIEFINKTDNNIRCYDFGGQMFTLAQKQNGTLSISMTSIEKLVNLLAGTRLLVIETLNQIACAGSLDENSSTDMSYLISAIGILSRRVGCATVALHHVRKETADADDENLTLGSVRGSSVLVDNARWVMLMKSMTEKAAKARFSNEIWQKEQNLWVKRVIAKQNHSDPVESVWLKRIEGGVLSGAEQPPTTRQGKQKAASNRDPKSGFRYHD